MAGRRFVVPSSRIALLGALSLAMACASNEGPTQDKIGSAQVSILSVATWDAYMNGLQPRFELSADEALAKVIPSVMRSDDRILDALQAAFRAAAPARPAEEKTEGSITGSGAPSTAGAIEAKIRSAKPAGENTVDPVLQYQAAAALFQEVQLLNRYVRDAAQRRDSTPYVVRLQVSVSPWRRELGYDAVTNVSFFPGRDPIKGILEQFGKGSARVPTQGVIPGTPNEYAGYSAPKSVNVVPLLVTGDLDTAMRQKSEEKLRQYGVALEVLMHGLGGDEPDMKKLNEKLRLVSGGAAHGQMTFGKVTENTLSIRSGAVPTSETEAESQAVRYTMVAQTHNVSVLILVPNSPGPLDSVHVVARTTFREQGTGREAPVEDREAWDDALLEIRNTIPWTDKFRLEDFQRLQMWVWNGLYPPFVQDLDAIVRVRLRSELRDSQEAIATWQRIRNDQDSLWTEIASLLVRSRYTLCDVDLPRIVAPTLAADQSALIVDDGSASSTVTLSGGGGLVRSNLSALLTLPPGEGSAAGAVIAATKVDVPDDGGTLVLTFPSLLASGLVAAPPAPAGAAPGKEPANSTFLQNASVRVDAVDASAWSSSTTVKTIFVSKGVVWTRPAPTKAPAAPAGKGGPSGASDARGAGAPNDTGSPGEARVPAAATPDAPKPFFDVLIGARVIVADEMGRGTIRATWQLTKPGSVEPPPGKAYFRVEGADLESVSSDPFDAISSTAGRWSISQNAASTLTLTNLARSTPVRLVATDEKGSATTVIELTVQTAPKSSKSD